MVRKTLFTLLQLAVVSAFAGVKNSARRLENNLRATTTNDQAAPVDVVLFGIGDLRTDDHLGLKAAIESKNQILPLFVLNSELIQNLPGAVAHSLDTIDMLDAALQDLKKSLADKFNLPLFCDTNLNGLPDNCNIHVCDLGKIDGEMGYTIRPETCITWNSFLRQRPWQSSSLPESYPAYKTKLANYPALGATTIDPDKSVGDRAYKLDDSKSVFNKDDLRAMFEQCVDLKEAERNTGLFSTHWGGLLPRTIGCEAVLKNLKSNQIPNGTANPMSLEHATMLWQGEANWQNEEKKTRYLLAPLFFGTISPRRVYEFGKSESPIAPDPLRQLVEGQEWHKLLAANSRGDDKYWRYHGMLCRYVETPMEGSSDTGILLVHGFGASGTQWNKAMKALKSFKQGLAPDLLGFGRSEKPALSYTGYLWDMFGMDFVKEIATVDHKYGWKKYVTGGNSIGGFTSMSMAACDSAKAGQISSSGAPGTGFCDGLVLMNSAGPVLNRDELPDTKLSVAEQTIKLELDECSPPARPVARAIGNVLLTYLRPSIKSICTNLYPTNPEAVDEELCQNIERDSLDPGAVYVMMAGAKLPPPRTTNELLNADFGSPSDKECKFEGPVLVAQGVLDPLNDAKDRMERIGSLRAGIEMDPIQAGHCPHDEVPLKVAESIEKWMATRSTVDMAESPQVAAVNQ